MKKEIQIQKANRLINHGPVVLVSLLANEKPNILSVAWNMPVSHKPMCIAIASGHSNYSTNCIKETGEFVINVPDKDLKKQVIECGTTSGKDIDKFQEFILTQFPSTNIKAPGVEECIGHIECKVDKAYEYGDHYIFIAKVVYACVDKDKWDFENDIWLPDKANTLHHLGGSFFSVTREI